MSRYRPPALPVWLTMAALAVVALGVSAWLLYHSLLAGPNATLPGCGGGGGKLDCESVLRSRWSLWLGVPVSAPAIAVDLAALVLLAMIRPGRSRRTQRCAWLGLYAAALLWLGVAVWFVLVQAEMIGRFCLYCLAAHGAAAVLGITILGLAPVGRTRLLPDEPEDPGIIPPRALGWPVLAAAAALAALIGGQLLFQPATFRVQQIGTGQVFDTGPGPNRQLSLIAGRVRLNPHDYPIMGSPDAEHILVYLFDYTCPHCRKLHVELQDVLKRYGNQIGIVLLPVPLDPACNSTVEELEPRHRNACALAKLALAVWYTDKRKFPEFDRWLFEPEDPPPLEAARDEARRLLGAEALDQALTNPLLDRRIEGDVEVYKLSDAGLVPKIIAGTFISFSRPSMEDLTHMLEVELKVKPVTTQPAGRP